MRSSKVLSLFLFFLAFIFQVEASPSLLARKNNGCSKDNIATFNRVVTHKQYFCNWWLTASRTRSPFIELLASEVTAVCYCIGTPATNGKQPAATGATSYNGYPLQECRALLSAEFSEPWNFCKFYTRSTRASSPFKSFSVPQLLSLCDCIDGTSSPTSSSSSSKKPKTTSSSTSSINSESKTSSVTTSESSITDFPITTTTSVSSTSSVVDTTSMSTGTSSGLNSTSILSSINSTTMISSASSMNSAITSSTLASFTGSVTFNSSTSAPYSNGTNSTVPLGPTASPSISSSTFVPVNVTSNVSLSSMTLIPTGSSGGFPTSSGTSGAPYGNSTSSVPTVGPTTPIFPGNFSSINNTSSVTSFNGLPTGIIDPSSGPSLSSYSISGAPYGNGTSRTSSVGPTGVSSTAFSTTNNTVMIPSSTVNSTSSLASTGFPSSISSSGAPYGNGTSSMPTPNPTAPTTSSSSNISNAVSTNSTISAPTSSTNSSSIASSGFSSTISSSGAPYGNSTSSAPQVGPTAPLTTGSSSLSSSGAVTNSSASIVSTPSPVPSSGISSSIIPIGAPYGNSSGISLSSGPTAPLTSDASSTSSLSSSAASVGNGTSTFLPSSTFSVGPVNATSTESSNGTTTQSASTTVSQSSTNATITGAITTSAPSSSSTSQSTTSSSSLSSSSATSSQSSTPSQGSIRTGSRVFVDRSVPAYGNLALEATQDGQNQYANIYTRKQRPTLSYTFNETSGYLYLGQSRNVLSYAIPNFRSDSVQLATLSEDYLTTYPQSWNPLKCTVSNSGALSCSATSTATRFRPSRTYSVFVVVPREGQAAADIYLYAANKIDGRPLGATQVTFDVSTDGQGW